MNFDFSALAQVKKEIDKKDPNVKKTKPKKKEPEIEVVDIIETDEGAAVAITVNEDTSNSKMTTDEKIDMWIEEFKDLPKIVYNDTHMLCTYEEASEMVTILNKITNESIRFVDREFFEYAVYKTNTRPNKEQFILEKYEEITGFKIGRREPTMDGEDSPIDTIEEVTEEVEEEIEEEFNLPDDILDF